MSFTPQDPDMQVFDVNYVKRLLPHRYPYLYVDRMFNVRSKEGCVGLKNVTFNEPVFQGHFPGNPILPGVIILESMAQTASALVSHFMGLSDSGAMVYFMAADKVKFRKMVHPGDQMELHVSLLRERRNILRYYGEARVEGVVAAEAEFMALIETPKEELVR